MIKMEAVSIDVNVEARGLNENEKKILGVFAGLLPKLNANEQEKLLYFGEGIAFVKKQGRLA
jgi:hypothetical protein